MIRTARIEILAEIIEYLHPAMRRGGSTQLPATLAASTALRMSQRGGTCLHFHEVPIKQMATQRAVEKHLIIDKGKYGRMRAARFAAMAEFTLIVSG